MKMPFGKYKGREIVCLPDDYVVWLAENVRLKEPLKSEIELVLPKAKTEHVRRQYERALLRNAPREDTTDDDYFDGGINSWGDNGGFFG